MPACVWAGVREEEVNQEGRCEEDDVMRGDKVTWSEMEWRWAGGAARRHDGGGRGCRGQPLHH
jgi:hypothetical protein